MRPPAFMLGQQRSAPADDQTYAQLSCALSDALHTTVHIQGLDDLTVELVAIQSRHRGCDKTSGCSCLTDLQDLALRARTHINANLTWLLDDDAVQLLPEADESDESIDLWSRFNQLRSAAESAGTLADKVDVIGELRSLLTPLVYQRR